MSMSGHAGPHPASTSGPVSVGPVSAGAPESASMLPASGPPVPVSFDDASMVPVPASSASLPPPLAPSMTFVALLPEQAVSASAARRKAAIFVIEALYLSKPVFGGYG